MQKAAQPIANWHTYLNRRMAALVVLGFSSGLPLYILLSLMQAWLAKSGLSLKVLGLFTLLQFPYFWKFTWAPLMDRFSFGGFGRRRGWMVLTQCALFFAIGGMGMLDPRLQVGAVVAATALVAFLSASQDIVIDAYRSETLSEREQGLGAAVYVNAYKVSSMVPGALSLILADRMAWPPVFWITAAFMLPGLLCALLIREPRVYGERPATLRAAVVLPFKEFIERDGWRRALWLLAFILLYKVGDSMATALATKFYLDLGFSMTEIGWAANTTGFWASIAGGIVGGVWMIRLGINRGLWVFGALQAVAILGFAWLALVGPSTPLLAAVIGFEAFASMGLGGAAMVAFMSRSTDARYTATQYALFSALASVPRIFVNASVGFVIAETGWFWFFIVCFFLAFPAMMMLPKIAPWNAKQ
ncbi:AmpG family muropeptide MFS transporter [Rugamonas sp. DEMB1]|uniref:AmpG family muropeptide MFS transporter n=1 Tax=Rugamonas sp. DEMB1 TaxID=3039386 RepID=UPI00244B944C|nr:AmpG family muropeptide MFS transporter [Rugamonas sp. DEMB1]WGG49768.1 AmpG family muropeptide MFS transporter [Rugamonas sp. DEMB1]